MNQEINLKQQKIIDRITSQYKTKETTKLDELKTLDKKARKGANVFAYVFGTMGSLVLGAGMSIAMQVILADYMLLGILIGCVGIIMVGLNYFIYKALLKKGKNKYASQILEISNELLK